MVIESVLSLLPSTGLVFVFFNWKNLVFARMNLKPEEFCVCLGNVFPSLRINLIIYSRLYNTQTDNNVASLQYSNSNSNRISDDVMAAGCCNDFRP